MINIQATYHLVIIVLIWSSANILKAIVISDSVVIVKFSTPSV